MLFPAASDAYCLLEIYERLCKDPESFGLSSDLTESLVGKQSKKPKAKKQLSKQEAPSPSGQVCKHLQRAACCSRPLQITGCCSQSHIHCAWLFPGLLQQHPPHPSLPGFLLGLPGSSFPCTLRFTCLCTVWVQICAQSPVSLVEMFLPHSGFGFCGQGFKTLTSLTFFFFLSFHTLLSHWEYLLYCVWSRSLQS